MRNVNQPHVVIVGGGQAGAVVAKTLLAYGCQHKITLVCEEPHLPYERPPLSKAVLAGEKASAPLILPAPMCDADTRPSQLNILIGKKAVGLERHRKTVTLADGEPLSFSKLVIATGGIPRRLPLDPSVRTGVHYLRTVADAASLRTTLAGSSNVLIIGGGWIGLETAATARMMGKNVVLLEADTQLCRRSLPASVAELLSGCHQRQGVDIRLGSRLDHFVADERGAISHAVLDDGSLVAADVVIVGIGLIPETGLAQSAGLLVRSGIVVDREGRTTDPDIYAAGDVAECECPWHGGATRIESWHNANTQAGIVAASIMGQALPSRDPPWFWSDQFGLNIQVVGVPRLADQAICRAHEPESTLSVYFRRGEICGAISINRARDLRIISQAMKNACRIDIEELKEIDRPIQDIVQKAGSKR